MNLHVAASRTSEHSDPPYLCKTHAANTGETTVGTWIKCTDERGQTIHANLDNVATLLPEMTLGTGGQ